MRRQRERGPSPVPPLACRPPPRSRVDSTSQNGKPLADGRAMPVVLLAASIVQRFMVTSGLSNVARTASKRGGMNELAHCAK